jgi:hypothetical protein
MSGMQEDKLHSSVRQMHNTDQNLAQSPSRHITAPLDTPKILSCKLQIIY